VVTNFNCHPSTDASGAYRSVIATVSVHEGTSWGWLAQSAVIGRKCEAVEVKCNSQGGVGKKPGALPLFTSGAAACIIPPFLSLDGPIDQ
jgi:hypothetical protein